MTLRIVLGNCESGFQSGIKRSAEISHARASLLSRMLRNTKLLTVEKRRPRNSQPQRLVAQMIRERDQMAKPWRAAVNKLRGQLETTLMVREAANRRSQCGRLIDSLIPEIGDGAILVKVYWLFWGWWWSSGIGYNAGCRRAVSDM